jgi:hypothetical protein
MDICQDNFFCQMRLNTNTDIERPPELIYDNVVDEVNEVNCINFFDAGSHCEYIWHPWVSVQTNVAPYYWGILHEKYMRLHIIVDKRNSEKNLWNIRLVETWTHGPVWIAHYDMYYKSQPVSRGRCTHFEFSSLV